MISLKALATNLRYVNLFHSATANTQLVSNGLINLLTSIANMYNYIFILLLIIFKNLRLLSEFSS